MHLIQLMWSTASESKLLTMIKADLQPFFSAESGGINWPRRSKLNQPFRIDLDAVMTSHELDSWAEFDSARLKYGVWTGLKMDKQWIPRF